MKPQAWSYNSAIAVSSQTGACNSAASKLHVTLLDYTYVAAAFSD
jgi:hypothetical protein